MGKEKKHKHDRKKKDKKKKHKRRSPTSSESSSQDEWVEKTEDSKGNISKREDWLSLPANFLTASNKEMKEKRAEEKRLDKQKEQYDPKTSVRELNPFWKDNGTGLPSKGFKKPVPDDEMTPTSSYKSSYSDVSTSNWKKVKNQSGVSSSNFQDVSSKQDSTQTLNASSFTKKDINALGAKLLKAEIMGNTELAEQISQQLVAARNLTSDSGETQVMLTQTDSKGFTRPLEQKYSEQTAKPRKKQKVETHSSGERVRYFADDDKYSLNRMFEEERFNNSSKQNAEFLSALGKSNRNDDLDDIFSDKIRNKKDDAKEGARDRDRAITEHKQLEKTIDTCRMCPTRLEKQTLVAIHNGITLSVPLHEPLTEGHCIIAPVSHTTCSTQLDEDVWEQIMDVRRSLTAIFKEKDQDVIFFEVAVKLHRHPHMRIECIPVDREFGDEAPIYFKKAIDEAEAEWSTNKKLVSLQGKNVRRAVPKGLPYFFVSFGMQEGYAHIVEDEELFPTNFAQEIIAGALDLDHRKWKRPRMQKMEEQGTRAKDLKKLWSLYAKA